MFLRHFSLFKENTAPVIAKEIAVELTTAVGRFGHLMVRVPKYPDLSQAILDERMSPGSKNPRKH